MRALVHALCALGCICTSAFASGRATGPAGPLRTAYSHVRVEIDGDLARTTLTQVFVNDLDAPVEATYGFPLPTDAAVTGFAEWREGRRVEARAKGKATARKAYDKAVEKGERAALAEHARDAFRLSLYALPPSGSRRVELSYTQTLSALGGERGYTFPRRSDEQAPSLLDLEVRVASSRALTDFVAPNHPDARLREVEIADFDLARAGFSAHLSRSRAGLAADFVLRWRQESDPIDLAARAVRPDPDAPAFVEARVAFVADPWPELRVSRDVIIVLDHSLSMAGEPLERAKALVHQILDGLHPGDRFELLRFGTGVEALFSGSDDAGLRFADPEQVEAARAAVDGTMAKGRSNLQGALDASAHLLSTGEGKNGSDAVVVLLTDGQPTLRAKGRAFDLDVDAASFGEARVVIGHFNYPRRAKDLEGVLPNVTARFVPDGVAADKALTDIARLAVAPTIDDVQLEITGGAVHEVHGRLPTRLAVGEHIRLMGRLDGTATVELRGWLHGRPVELRSEVFVPAEPSAKGDLGLPVEWARLRIQDLNDEARASKVPAVKEMLEAQVRGLGTQYNLATRFTSYVITDSLVPDRIKPGDPEIRIHAPETALGVSAVLPWGEIIDCEWSEDEGLWFGRFLVPRDVDDGLYRARILVEKQAGTQYRGVLFFRVDSQPPQMRLDYVNGRLRAVPDRPDPVKGLDRIDPDPIDLKAVVAVVAGRKIVLEREDDAEAWSAALKVPVGVHGVRVLAHDYARNVSESFIRVRVEVEDFDSARRLEVR